VGKIISLVVCSLDCQESPSDFIRVSKVPETTARASVHCDVLAPALITFD